MQRRAALLALLVAAVALAPIGGSAAPPRTSDAYRVAFAKRVARGVTHFRIVSRDQRINVARIRPDATVAPIVGVARGGPVRGKQRTSTMCARTGCLVGVNGEPFITRRYDRPHLIIGRDGSFSTGRVEIPIQLRVRYKHPLEPVDERLGTDTFADREASIAVQGLNDDRERDQLIVYTPRRGKTTRTSEAGVDVVAQIVSTPKRLQVGETVRLKLRALVNRGDAAIPADGVVLSGRGEAARTLRTLWEDVRSGAARSYIKLKVRGPGNAAHVIGGRPVLIKEGRILEPPGSWFSTAPHARTLAGWSRDGTLYLVTIDRGNGARGMSLAQAARFMKRLGAWGAINLDGGGSSTFVRRSTVRNSPQHGGERAVGSSLLIVPDRG